MAAPTWPPTPEEAARLTMEEYGLEKSDLGLEDPEELEAALLAQHLFADPKRVDSHSSRDVGTPLAQVRRRLEAWLRMVSGRDFAIGVSDPPCTDGEDLYLPLAAPAPAEPEVDAQLYRVMGLVQLGLLELGFYESHVTLRRIYSDFVMRSAYHLLAARYTLKVYRERYPGVAKDFEAVAALAKASTLRVAVSAVPAAAVHPALWPLYAGLVNEPSWGPPRASAKVALAAVAAVEAAGSPVAARLVVLGQAQAVREACRHQGLGAPPLPAWLGISRPEWILAELADDPAAREAWREGLNRPLAMLQAAVSRERRRIPAPEVSPKQAPPKRGLRSRVRSLLGGRGPSTPAPSFAEAPTTPVSPRPSLGPSLQADAPPKGLPDKEQGEGEALDEWDYERGVYRVAYTRVAELDAPGGALSNYERLVEANAREIRAVRRRFAALRQEDRWVTGLPDGPEIDLDRALTALTDIAAGQQPKDDLYRRFVRHPQDLCALTLVDLSGSTQGRVLHLEQEALVLLSEGLRTLALPHAFYGFSGDAPQRCHLWRLKGFDEGYGDPVLRRLGNLRASGATRMGAYIRGASKILARRPQPRRLLLLLSDGRPEDKDAYRGPYGVADTAMAVREASRVGVRCFCVSLDDDEHAESYLRPIFGSGRYLRLSRVEALPTRLPEVFRALM